MDITDYTLESDNTPWRLFAHKDHDKEWAVLWLQGFESTIEMHTDGVVRMSEQTKTTFAMLNYAGHGNHPVPLSDATRMQQSQEVIAVYDALRERGYSKIIVIGGSFGAYMAALLSAERELEAIALRAPAVYADEEFELPFKETRSGQNDIDVWRKGVSEHTDNAALTAVRNFEGNVFVLEHELDSIVSATVPKTYAAVAKHSNYIVIRGCDHSPKLMPNPQKFFAVIEHWLEAIIVAEKLAQK